MVEALSVIGLVSSIVQFVDFGIKVVDRLNKFQSEVSEMPKPFSDIKNQLPLLIDALRRTQSQADAGHMSEKTAEALKPVVDGCLTQIKLLEDIMVKAIPAENASTWNRRFKALSSLTYDKKVQHIASTIEGYVQKLIYHQVTCTLSVREPSQQFKPETKPRKAVFMVKFDRDPNFIGREGILREIDERLKMPRHRVAIVGIGGVGKSQIAIEYCYRYRSDHPEARVFWVHASSHARFEEAYKGIARELALPGFDDSNVNTLQLVSRWLSNDANGPWLLVLDNADNMEMFFGHNHFASSSQNGQQRTVALVDLLPRSSDGSILITSRDRRVGERFANRERPIAVLPFGMHDAECLFRSKLVDGHEWNKAESMELLEALGFLPLAITQAAAYISEEEVTLAHYLDLLRSDDLDMRELLEQNYYDPGRDSEIQNSIFLTWKISFDQIRKQKPRAAEILSLMAVLDRNSISHLLLRKKDEGKVSFDTAIGMLKGFSLVTEEKEGAAFGMHRLVQLSMQWWLELQHVLVEYQERSLDAVSVCCPSGGDYTTWTDWEVITPHIEAVLGYALKTEPCLLKRASVLSNAACYDWERGRYEAAYRRGMEAKAIRQRILGKEHPETLTSMNNVALVLETQSKRKKAEEMHRLTLEIREKVLGKEHPDTLTSMSNLAAVLRNQGFYEEAEKMHQLALGLRGEVLGKEHPDTLTSMSSVAGVLESQGKYEEAEKMGRLALGVREKVLGKEHPHTLMSMSNLATVLGRQGKYEEAEEMHRRAFETREKVLRKEHADTLASMNNLAWVLDRRGKYGEAEDMHRRALGLFEEVLGNENAATLASMNNLALVLGSQGKDEEAEEILRRGLEIKEKEMGKEHPDTLLSMANLALVLGSQGKYEEAEKMSRLALEGREKLLGKEHPDTLMSVYYLAFLLHIQCQYKDASSLYQRACAGYGKTLGLNHPTALACSKHYSSMLEHMRFTQDHSRERGSGCAKLSTSAGVLSRNHIFHHNPVRKCKTLITSYWYLGQRNS